MLVSLFLLQTALTIAVGGPATTGEYLPLIMAGTEERVSREAGSVTLRYTKGEAGAAEALAKGEALLAATTLDAALRHGAFQGKPPRLVFAFTAAPLVTLISSPTIGSIGELSGKTIGIPATGSSDAHVLVGLLARHRVPLSKVKLVSLGDRGVAHAIERGEIRAGLLPEPWASQLLAT